MQVQVLVKSARDLKNVNWRNGLLQPYAVAYIDSSGKCSTPIDRENKVNPVWNEKFTITLRPTSRPETAILYIDVVHANPCPNTKQLIGSMKFPLSATLIEAQANGMVSRSVELKRPCGRPQGIIEIMIGLKVQKISPKDQQVQLDNRPMPPRVNPMQPPVRPQIQSLRPLVQFNPQFRQQGIPSPQLMVPIYRPGYRPINTSLQAYNQVMRGMAPVNYNNNLLANNNNATNLNVEVVYLDGQPSDGGCGGNGFSSGGGFDNGYGPDMSGMDNGSVIDSSGFCDGYEIDSSGFGDGSEIDCGFGDE